MACSSLSFSVCLKHQCISGDRRWKFDIVVGRKDMYVFRGELSYLAPLGSENISAPYFKQCF